MHKSFFPLFCVSLVGVLGASLFGSVWSQWLGLAIGILPLARYHFNLYQQHALTSIEIDSVYYFGFLVTVVTLVATALSIGLMPTGTKPELNSVLLKFGLGLIATGYSLFARLQLQSKSGGSADAEANDATLNLAKSISNVAQEFNKAEHQVQSFVELTQQRLAAMEQSLGQSVLTRLAATEARFEESLSKAAVEFRESISAAKLESITATSEVLRSATKAFADAISSVMEEVGRIQVEAEAVSFEKASKRISEFSEDIESTVRSIANVTSSASHDAAVSIKELATTVKLLQKHAVAVSNQLDSLNSIERLLSSLSSSAEAFEGVTNDAGVTSASLASLRESIGKVELKFQENVINPIASTNLGTVLTKAQRSLEAVGASASKAAGSLDAVQPKIVASLEKLVGGVERLESQTDSFSLELIQRHRQLDTAISSIVTGIANMSNLKDLAPSVATAVEQLKALAGAVESEAALIRSQSSYLTSSTVLPSGAS